MELSIDQLEFGDVHPIDIVEQIASNQKWDFDRTSEEQISMAIEGQWRTYEITLAWSAMDETLRMLSTFEMTPPEHRIDNLMQMLNAVNDNIWAGSFIYWQEQNVMVYRYGLVLAGGQSASLHQIDTMISCAVSASEKYYPAFQLATWGEKSVKESLQVAMTKAYGRA